MQAAEKEQAIQDAKKREKPDKKAQKKEKQLSIGISDSQSQETGSKGMSDTRRKRKVSSRIGWN